MTSVRQPLLRKVGNAGNLYVVNGRNIFSPLNLDANRLSAYGSLKVSNAGYWKLGEATGAARADSSPNATSLTNNNNCAQVAGKSGNATSLARASSQFLSAVSNSGIVLGGGAAFTIAGWLYANSDANFNTLVAKDLTSAAADLEYALYRWTDNKVYFDVSDGSAIKEIGTSGTMTNSVWHFLAAWYDPVAQTINVQIDNGTVSSVAMTTVPLAATSPFAIGRKMPSGSPVYNDGIVDAVGLWKRKLSAAELTILYNAGAGLEIY